MAIKCASGHGSALIARIDFREAGTNRDHQMSLSGIPNGIFLAHLIAHAATEHGVEMRDYQRL